jgi:hypothetical protein
MGGEDSPLPLIYTQMEETLEEAFKKWSGRTQVGYDKIDVLNFGAKWQAERMYSEEDMLKCWNAAYIDALSIDEETYKPLFFADFIEQFKKK